MQAAHHPVLPPSTAHTAGWQAAGSGEAPTAAAAAAMAK
jgi:hypothetical protein